MNKLPKVIASALVKNNGKYLFVREVLESGNHYWIVPGGHVEFGETIEDAARREIKEETNLDIEIVKFLGFKEAIHTKYDYHTVIFFFLAKALNGIDLDRATDKKVLDAKFFSREELKSLNLVPSAKWLLDNHMAR